MLTVRDIHTYYGNSHVIQGISFAMESGQVTGILGRNGMGKTTLIRSIIGFTPPREGQVLFKQHDITAWPANRVVDIGLGLVPQGGRVIENLKSQGLSILLVEQNLPLALRVCDQVHVLSRGRIVHSWSSQALWENEEIKSRYLGF